MKNLSRKQIVSIAAVVLVVVLIIVGIAVSGNGNGYEHFIVERRDLVDDVNIAGSVEAGVVADTGFEVSGRVVSVAAREGDVVPQGHVLVMLDLGTLSADLLSAEANLKIKQAEFANFQTNLAEVTKKQDTLVKSAYSTLLSEGLVAEPLKDSYTQTAPTISGLYSGIEEGQYKIRIKYDAGRRKHTLDVRDLEKPALLDIDETKATPLGTRGLFISFPDALSTYEETTWFVDIPNERSSVYLENYNSYQEALNTRDSAIEEAQAEVKEQNMGASIAEAEMLQAEAEVARAQAEINKRILRAPFAGIVTQVEVDPGEIVSANSIAVSMIADDGFGIEVDLPEIDSVKVSVGDSALVTLDAFGDDTFFDAEVVSVNRTETIVDNVSVYEARLLFDEEDERIASGMTADVTITTDTRENALAVPARAIRFKDDGEQFVFVQRNGKEEEAVIATGLRGSDGFIEVTAGLSESETVLIPKR